MFDSELTRLAKTTRRNCRHSLQNQQKTGGLEVKIIMTPFSQKLLRTSGALIAISMLSACATNRSNDSLGDKVFDTIGSVTETTIDVSGRALANAKDFLGLYPTPDGKAGTQNVDSQSLDGGIDMALIDEDQTLLDDNADIVIEATDSRTAFKQPLDNELANRSVDSTLENNDDLPLDADTALALANPDPLAKESLAAKPAAVETTPAQSVATADLLHEVEPQQNLWDIAKQTTGDANNWHILADINNLAPDASVFPGQQLTIPADMVKPGYFDVTTPALNEPVKTAAQIEAPTAPTAKPAPTSVAEASSDTTRLVIPEQSAPTSEAPAVADITANAEPFEIAPDESLWFFAKRTTGDATNWKAIAAQNNFTEKQAVTVRAGQTIFVPKPLIKAEGVTVAKVAKPTPSEATEATDVAAAQTKLNETDGKAVDAAAGALASATSVLDETQPIKIVEAKFQSDDTTATPAAIDTTTLATEASQQLDSNAGEQIMVSGTYYPKAIYNEADFASSLLMRVSPGTQLTVSKAVGPWYEVMTDKGVGYVHTRDIK